MNDLTGQPGELKATITITRKATGKVETYELTGIYHGDPEIYVVSESWANPGWAHSEKIKATAGDE